ncbi:MAG: hypothetical protein OXD30_11475, partial [Bryobacterales bacterium]|nr:hypothetical protein [Bryobacterales bacterium]
AEQRCWLHAVFVGVVWISARLQPGGSDVAGGWREQLEQDLRPLLLRLAACELRDEDWTPLDNERQEEAYVVLRRTHADGQRLLLPHYSFILVSRDDLPLVELVRRRAKQGQENACKGPLPELNLHHPPCKSYAANQAYYLCGLPAQMLPETAQGHGLGVLIRQLVRSVARLTRSGRRWRLHFARGNLRLAWLAQAWGSLEPPGTGSKHRPAEACPQQPQGCR